MNNAIPNNTDNDNSPQAEPHEFEPSSLAMSTGTPTSTSSFDPANLGLSQDFGAVTSAAKALTVIRVNKPSKSTVFRVHPDPKFRLKTTLLVLKEDNETYLVQPHLRSALAKESLCGVYTLFPCVTKAGTPFLFPVRMAAPEGKWNIWHQTAFQIAERATESWARMQANIEAGCYTADFDKRPPHQQQAPNWPDLAFKEWLRLAFQDFSIDTIDHPVLKRLRLED